MTTRVCFFIFEGALDQPSERDQRAKLYVRNGVTIGGAHLARAATILVKRHGTDAAIVAAQRADELLVPCDPPASNRSRAIPEPCG
jgi:hypothetical protein